MCDVTTCALHHGNTRSTDVMRKVHLVDVQYVDKECSSSHGGDRFKCGIDHKSAINGALLNKLCATKSLRSRSKL